MGHTSTQQKPSKMGVLTPEESLLLQQMGNFKLTDEPSATMEGDNMDILEKYIDKLDRDQFALREDIRESERRTSERNKEIEQRMDERMNRIEDMLTKTNQNIDAKFEDTRKTMYSILADVHSSNRQSFWFFVATLISVLGMVAATIFGILQFVRR